MKHLKWAAAVLLLAAVPVFAWANVVHAQHFSNSVDEGQTVNSSLYSGGKTVDINGTVNGDVFCGGRTITIDATVNGDVICAGQDVTINGKVNGDIRAGGQTVSINAKVSGSVTVAAMDFSLDAHSSVGRDLTLTGDTMNIKGAVSRDVVSAGNNLIFNGTVGRNVKADGASIKLKSDARIGGNFSYSSDKKVSLASGATIHGTTDYAKPKKHANKVFFRSFSIAFYLFMLTGLLVLSLALTYFFPRFFQKSSDYIKNNFVRTLLVGLAASFVVPLLAIGLVISLVGIPLTVFLLIAWLFGVMLSGPIAGYYVGRMIFRDQPKSPLLITLVGGAVLITAYYLPLAGILVMMLAYWLGFGALILNLQEQTGSAKQPKKPTKSK